MSGYEVPELGRIEDAIDALDSPTSTDVFQATRPFDERAIASVAAQRATAGGGGGLAAPNWCVIEIDGGPGVGDAPTLSAANQAFSYRGSALTILEQSGTDFSIFDDGLEGLVLSAGGGFFQAGLLVDPRGVSAALDAGSTGLRWVQVGFSMGDQVPDLYSIGYDCSFQVGAQGQQTFAGLPGLTTPGNATVGNIRFDFKNPFGTDELTIDMWDAHALVIWQIG